MSRLAEIYKEEKRKGGGLGSALKERAKEKFDPRQFINQRGILPALFPSLKAYRSGAKRAYDTEGRRRSLDGSENTSNFSEQFNKINDTLNDIKESIEKSSKNVSVLPKMAKDMKATRENTNKLVKLFTVSQREKAEKYFQKESLDEAEYEAKFKKDGMLRGKDDKGKDKDKESFLGKLLTSLIGSAGEIAAVGAGLVSILAFLKTPLKFLGRLAFGRFGKLLGLAGIAAGAGSYASGKTDEYRKLSVKEKSGEGLTPEEQKRKAELKSDVITGAALEGTAGAISGAMGARSALKLARATGDAILDARTTSIGSIKNSTSNSKWSRFLKFVERKSPKLFAKIGVKLAQAAALATIPVGGWIMAAIQIGFALWTAYDIYELWKEFNNIEKEIEADVKKEQAPKVEEEKPREAPTTPASTTTPTEATTKGATPASVPQYDAMGNVISGAPGGATEVVPSKVSPKTTGTPTPASVPQYDAMGNVISGAPGATSSTPTAPKTSGATTPTATSTAPKTSGATTPTAGAAQAPSSGGYQKGKPINRVSGGKVQLPIASGLLSDVYGPRLSPYDRTPQNHGGIDIATYGKQGIPVNAPEDNLVVSAMQAHHTGKGGAGPLYIELSNEKGLRHRLLHLSAFGNVKVGQKVGKNDIIGFSGAAGTGPHVHWEVYNGNRSSPIDPLKALSETAAGEVAAQQSMPSGATEIEPPTLAPKTSGPPESISPTPSSSGAPGGGIPGGASASPGSVSQFDEMGNVISGASSGITSSSPTAPTTATTPTPTGSAVQTGAGVPLTSGATGQPVTTSPTAMPKSGSYAEKVGHGESGGKYDTVYGKAGGAMINGKPITENTIAEVSAWQSSVKGKNIHGAGKYGIMDVGGIAKAAGIDPNAKFDSESQEKMMQYITKTNASYLQRQGIKPTDANLALAHSIGAGGTAKIYKALQEGNGDAKVADVLGFKQGSAARTTNPHLEVSVKQYIAQMEKKHGGDSTTALESAETKKSLVKPSAASSETASATSTNATPTPLSTTPTGSAIQTGAGVPLTSGATGQPVTTSPIQDSNTSSAIQKISSSGNSYLGSSLETASSKNIEQKMDLENQKRTVEMPPIIQPQSEPKQPAPVQTAPASVTDPDMLQHVLYISKGIPYLTAGMYS